MEQADVVIIGGGIIGCSIAYNLARRGCRRVVLLEQGNLGSGSSLRAAGGVRVQFATPVNVAWSLAAHKLWAEFPAEFGADPRLQRVGYLFLASTPAEAELLARTAALVRSLGGHIEYLSGAEVPRACPGIASADVLAATYTPEDGYLSVHAALQGFARRAQELGASLREGCTVLDLHIAGGRVHGVRTVDGEIAADQVIIAGGAWSARVARWAQLDVPVLPRRRELFYSGPLQSVRGVPWTVDMSAGWYLRPEQDGILLSGVLDVEPSFSTQVAAAPPTETAAAAGRRVPALAAATWPHAWAGSLDTTPDAHAIVGPAPAAAGLYLCCGFAGHGVMHSPVAGRVMAEWLLDGSPRIADAAPLSPERFARGELLHEALHHSPA